MKKNRLRKFLVFTLVFAWLFTGWPVIWQNPRVPPGIQEVQAAAIPTYKASGTFTAGTGAITPPYPASMAANDVCLLVVTSENEAISLTTANGFVEVPTWSPQSAGTAAADPASRLAVFWKRTVGGDSAPVVADSGNNTEGVIHCFSGVIASGNPWDTGAGGNDSAANDTTGTIPGSTTTVDNTLVVLITSTSVNGTGTANFSAWTNANLANITERQDNSNTAGLGGGSGMATGEKATAGSYTTTTVTLAATSYKGAISLALKPQPSTTTLADGTNPGNATISPGAAITDLDAFTLITSAGTDTVTAATVTLGPAGAYNNISQVDITDNSNLARCTAVTNLVSNTISFTTCTSNGGIPVTTTATTYKVRITPKTHANMPAVPGASYDTTGTVTSFTSTNTQSGSDTGSATITVDNLSPNGATATSGSAGNASVTLNWTTSNSADFATTNGSVILRWAAASAGSEVPAEGTTSYSAGNTISTATVACVISSAASTALSKIDGTGGSAGCTTTALTNGQVYSYKVFQVDTNGNYDAGVSIGSFTPVLISVSITTTNTFDYGFVAVSATKSTLQLTPAGTQTAKNDGSATENFNIKTSNATGGTQWTLGATPGTDIFVHEFSTNGGVGWTAFTVAGTYQTLAIGIGASGTQNFDLRITAPSWTSDYQQKSIVITVQAVAP